MKNLLCLLFALFITGTAIAQHQIINLRFDLTGGPDDELEMGRMYTIEEMMAIKNMSPEYIPDNNFNQPFPEFLPCPVAQKALCISTATICSEQPFEFMYSFEYEEIGCAAVFDGDQPINAGNLLCDLFISGNATDGGGSFVTSCENDSFCAILFVYGTGIDGCVTSASAGMNQIQPCVPRSESPGRFCVSTIPTLSQWGLIILGLGLSIIGFVAVRKKIFRPA